MGWKGAVRSFGAAIRESERAAKRRQRELERQKKQYEKMQEQEQSAYEVDVYNNHIEVIQSIHKDCSPLIDWNLIAQSQQPKKTKKSCDREQQARHKLDIYKPNVITRILKRQDKKKAQLTEEIEIAINTDENNYKIEISEWEEKVEEWRKNVDIARSLLKGDSKTKLEVIKSLEPFSEISNLGSNISIVIFDNGLLEATIHVHGKEIVPTESKNLLKSGKLSIKKMPRGKFNEIYQDYVCSCVLRVANELFSIIPDALVIVTAVDELLNTQTGHLEEASILSAAISRTTINNLNLDTIAPSDSMNNFINNMSFKKTLGFEKIERIKPESLTL